jgi:hypothetical protein
MIIVCGRLVGASFRYRNLEVGFSRKPAPDRGKSLFKDRIYSVGTGRRNPKPLPVIRTRARRFDGRKSLVARNLTRCGPRTGPPLRRHCRYFTRSSGTTVVGAWRKALARLDRLEAWDTKDLVDQPGIRRITLISKLLHRTTRSVS